MTEAIVVLNAGSSSIKFSHFIDRDGDLELDLRGQIEGLYTKPRFVAKGPDGTPQAEKTWDEGATLGHLRLGRREIGNICKNLARPTHHRQPTQ